MRATLGPSCIRQGHKQRYTLAATPWSGGRGALDTSSLHTQASLHTQTEAGAQHSPQVASLLGFFMGWGPQLYHPPPRWGTQFQGGWTMGEPSSQAP